MDKSPKKPLSLEESETFFKTALELKGSNPKIYTTKLKKILNDLLGEAQTSFNLKFDDPEHTKLKIFEDLHRFIGDSILQDLLAILQKNNKEEAEELSKYCSFPLDSLKINEIGFKDDKYIKMKSQKAQKSAQEEKPNVNNRIYMYNLIHYALLLEDLLQQKIKMNYFQGGQIPLEMIVNGLHKNTVLIALGSTRSVIESKVTQQVLQEKDPELLNKLDEQFAYGLLHQYVIYGPAKDLAEAGIKYWRAMRPNKSTKENLLQKKIANSIDIARNISLHDPEMGLIRLIKEGFLDLFELSFDSPNEQGSLKWLKPIFSIFGVNILSMLDDHMLFEYCFKQSLKNNSSIRIFNFWSSTQRRAYSDHKEVAKLLHKIGKIEVGADAGDDVVKIIQNGVFNLHPHSAQKLHVLNSNGEYQPVNYINGLQNGFSDNYFFLNKLIWEKINDLTLKNYKFIPADKTQFRYKAIELAYSQLMIAQTQQYGIYSLLTPIKKPEIPQELQQCIPFSDLPDTMSAIEYMMRVMYPLNPSFFMLTQGWISGQSSGHYFNLDGIEYSQEMLLTARMLTMVCDMMEEEIKRDEVLKDPFSYMFNFQHFAHPRFYPTPKNEEHFKEYCILLSSIYSRMAKLGVQRMGKVDKSIFQQNPELLDTHYKYFEGFLTPFDKDFERVQNDNYSMFLEQDYSGLTKHYARQSQRNDEKIKKIFSEYTKQIQKVYDGEEKSQKIAKRWSYDNEMNGKADRASFLKNISQSTSFNAPNAFGIKKIETSQNHEVFAKTSKKITNKNLQKQIYTAINSSSIDSLDDSMDGSHMYIPVPFTTYYKQPDADFEGHRKAIIEELWKLQNDKKESDPKKEEEQKQESQPKPQEKKIEEPVQEKTIPDPPMQVIPLKYFVSSDILCKKDFEERIKEVQFHMVYVLQKLVEISMLSETPITETYIYNLKDIEKATNAMKSFDKYATIYFLRGHISLSCMDKELTEFIQKVSHEYNTVKLDLGEYVGTLYHKKENFKEILEEDKSKKSLKELFKDMKPPAKDYAKNYEHFEFLQRFQYWDQRVNIYTDTDNYAKQGKEDDQVQFQDTFQDDFVAGTLPLFSLNEDIEDYRIFFFDDEEIAGLMDVFNLQHEIFSGSGFERCLVKIITNAGNAAKFLDLLFFTLFNKQILSKECDHPIVKLMTHSSLATTDQYCKNALHFLDEFNDINCLTITIDQLQKHRVRGIDDLKSKYKYSQKIGQFSTLLELYAEYHFNYANEQTRLIEKICQSGIKDQHNSDQQLFDKFPAHHELVEMVIKENQHVPLDKKGQEKYPFKVYFEGLRYFPKQIPAILVCAIEYLIEDFKYFPKGIESALEQFKIDKSNTQLSFENFEEDFQPSLINHIQIVTKILQDMFSTFFTPTSSAPQSQEDKEKCIEIIDACIMILEHDDIASLILTLFEFLERLNQYDNCQLFDYYREYEQTLIRICMNFTIIFTKYHQYNSKKARQNRFLQMQKAQKGESQKEEEKKDDQGIQKDPSKLLNLAYKLMSKIDGGTKDENVLEEPLPQLKPKSISEVKENLADDFSEEHLFILFVDKYQSRITDEIDDRSFYMKAAQTIRDRYNWIFGNEQVDTNVRDALYDYLEANGQKPDYEKDYQVVRKKLVVSMMENFMKLGKEAMTRSIHVVFEGEIGIDAGGLRRELCHICTDAVLNPEFGLFKIGEGSNQNLVIDPDSIAIPFFERYFEFAGAMLGKSMLERVYAKGQLSRYLLKTLLGHKLSIADLQDFDKSTYESMLYVIENENIGDILDTDFTYTGTYFGTQYLRELIPKGQSLMVDDSNKEMYVKLFCEAKMITECEPQLNAFLRGFRSVVPLAAIRRVTPSQLSLAISGPSTIDVQEMKDTCGLYGYTKNSDVIKWLFEVLEEFTQEQLAKFLFFVTGSSRPPYGGFKNGYRIYISSMGNSKRLPVSHTCSTQIDLPSYESKDMLREKILLAINNGSEFHIG